MKKTPVIWRVLLGVVLCALIVFAYARPCFSRGECAALIALGQRGSPYVFGKEGPDDFDCSGLVRYCYAPLGTDVIHSAEFIGYDDGYQTVENVRDLKVGDLIFFNTIPDRDECDHVGIWLGGNRFVQASSNEARIVVSSFSDSWVETYSWGKHILAPYDCPVLNAIDHYLPQL